MSDVSASTISGPTAPIDLVEASWALRGRPMERRERRIEAAVTLLFAGVATLLALLALGEWRPDAGIAALVGAYALAARVKFPIGLAATLPTQLFLIPLFCSAPAAVVPLLVAGALALGHVVAVVAGRGRLDRITCVGGDAMHAVGPAAVITLAGTEVLSAPAWVLVLALLAQFPVDLLSGMVRERLISGVAPTLQVLVHVRIYAADMALAPVGFIAARTTEGPAVAALALLPLLGLLAYAAHDRKHRIATAHERLEALESERARLRLAVRRIGDAFAANLDGRAILGLVAATAGDALQGDVSRGTSRQARARPAVGDHDAALWLAEERALDADQVEGAQVGVVCSIACPLPSLGAVVSVARSGEPYSGDESALLAYLCERADVAAGNATRHQFVARQAVTDELTGLANHRHFQEVLDASLAERPSGGSELSLVLIDLDDFKTVNDTHGHLAGDDVLRQVGRCLRETCRSGDHPARYGGEEFAVVLDGLELDQVLALGERIRQAVADAAISAPTGEPLTVTASIGIARMLAEDVSRRDLIAAADAALYEAKRRGKDCVTWVDLDDSSALIDERIVMSSARASRALHD